MAEAGFCVDCAQWRYEFNTAFQTQDEQDGFGICDRVEAMREKPSAPLPASTTNLRTSRPGANSVASCSFPADWRFTRRRSPVGRLTTSSPWS